MRPNSFKNIDVYLLILLAIWLILKSIGAYIYGEVSGLVMLVIATATCAGYSLLGAQRGRASEGKMLLRDLLASVCLCYSFFFVIRLTAELQVVQNSGGVSKELMEEAGHREIPMELRDLWFSDTIESARTERNSFIALSVVLFLLHGQYRRADEMGGGDETGT